MNNIERLLKESDPHIPEGKYLVDIISWETNVRFVKAPKVDMTFSIIDGEYAGVKIHCHRNVKRFIGKPGKKGRFEVGKKSKLARQFFRAMESGKRSTANLRLDRLPLTQLKNVEVKVRSVKKESDNKPIPTGLWYSVIDEMIQIKSN